MCFELQQFFLLWQRTIRASKLLLWWAVSCVTNTTQHSPALVCSLITPCKSDRKSWKWMEQRLKSMSNFRLGCFMLLCKNSGFVLTPVISPKQRHAVEFFSAERVFLYLYNCSFLSGVHLKSNNKLFSYCLSFV